MLPSVLQQEVILSLYGSFFRNAEVLRGADDAILNSLAQYLFPTWLAMDTTIYEYGDYDNDLYFVRSGLVLIEEPSDENIKKRRGVRSAGQTFGDRSFFLGGKRYETAKSVSSVELLVLPRRAIRESMSQHVGFLRELHQLPGVIALHKKAL